MSKNNKKEDSKIRRRRKITSRLPKWSYPLIFGTAVGGGVVLDEMITSRHQSDVFNDIAQKNTYHLTEQDNAEMVSSPLGPYDTRLGYTERDQITDYLMKKGYERTTYATGQIANIEGYLDLFPIYPEKIQTGLTLTDTNDDVLYQNKFPRRAYQNVSEIPQLLIDSLCFVENKELCDRDKPQKNPAIEWGRFSHAVLGQLKDKMGIPNDGSGGSTLATQLEKVRHSKDGITRTYQDKLQQMATATAKAYRNGLDTVEERERIVRDYINEMPLAAFPGYGEVIGFADGISVWFNADWQQVNELLSQDQDNLSDEELRPIAKAYRQTLTLIMAVKQPSEYLINNRDAMQRRVESYLPILAKNGVISERFMRLAREEAPQFATTLNLKALEKDEPKSTDTIRIRLMEELGQNDIVKTEMWDMSAKSTMDGKITEETEKRLQEFKDPTSEVGQNLTGFRMANAQTAHQIEYAVTLYEATDKANILRVQADTFQGQFNFNEKSKLELGSTAKLRTLITYLEVIEELHQKFLNMSEEEKAQKTFNKDDHLSIWVHEYMTTQDTDKSKEAILEAAMQRQYSGSISESFFTGGAYHRFQNFQFRDHYRTLTVEEATRRSVNLPFIRMMRDIVNYTLYNSMNIAPDIYEDKEEPQRTKYLNQYADQESTLYLWRFWKELKNKSPDEIAETLALKTYRSPAHLTVVYRAIFPEAGYQETAEFIKKYCDKCYRDGDYRDTFEQYAPGKFDINDQAYITGLNEIELWLGFYLTQNKDADWSELKQHSTEVREQAYEWLMKSSRMHAQNKRIRIMIEQEAFDKHIIHRWKKQGFPFDEMVASYASSIGVSGDNPGSLADLAGIIMNEGKRKTTSVFNEISFAKDTPYETNFRDFYEPAEQVLSPEVAAIAHRAMQDVVQEGTARRAKNAVKLDNGEKAIVGGKTGTGDNRKQIRYDDGTRQSIAVNRTATFMFTINDCMFGTIVAYAPGDMADDQKFTSSLPVQALKELVPTWQPLFDQACEKGYTPKEKYIPKKIELLDTSNDHKNDQTDENTDPSVNIGLKLEMEYKPEFTPPVIPAPKIKNL